MSQCYFNVATSEKTRETRLVSTFYTTKLGCLQHLFSRAGTTKTGQQLLSIDTVCGVTGRWRWLADGKLSSPVPATITGFAADSISDIMSL